MLLLGRTGKNPVPGGVSLKFPYRILSSGEPGLHALKPILSTAAVHPGHFFEDGFYLGSAWCLRGIIAKILRAGGLEYEFCLPAEGSLWLFGFWLPGHTQFAEGVSDPARKLRIGQFVCRVIAGTAAPVQPYAFRDAAEPAHVPVVLADASVEFCDFTGVRSAHRKNFLPCHGKIFMWENI